MNYEEFFERAKNKGLSIPIEREKTPKNYQLSNEALFHIPLIAMVVLILAKDRRKPYVSEIGQLVGESLERSIIGFKGSSQHLGWSAYLRVRTVKAINFLEHTRLIHIDNRKSKVAITDLGLKVVSRALDQDDDLAYNLVQIQRAYRNICVDKQLDLEIL